MDWGNAIVRSKTKAPDGLITAIDMELHLEGDFKKTKKKITWLAMPTSDHPHVNVQLFDYDYLITKKKLEEEDNVEDFITPVTCWTTNAVTDINIREVKRGDIIQFERRGYYILDEIIVSASFKFIRIPDGKAANMASKADVPSSIESSKKVSVKSNANDQSGRKYLSNGSSGFEIPVNTKMHEVGRVYGNGNMSTPVDTKMYQVRSVYGA